MLAWFSDLSARERRTMGACFGGWSLDAFDVQIFSFVIPSLLALWKISPGEAGELATITCSSRPSAAGSQVPSPIASAACACFR
jgi:hypothetical protein